MIIHYRALHSEEALPGCCLLVHPFITNFDMSRHSLTSASAARLLALAPQKMLIRASTLAARVCVCSLALKMTGLMLQLAMRCNCLDCTALLHCAAICLLFPAGRACMIRLGVLVQPGQHSGVADCAEALLGALQGARTLRCSLGV